MIVAIDGPAGSGKSTVAKLVAQKIGFKYIDTGAYYRWLTYNVLKNKFTAEQSKEIIILARHLDYQNIPDDKIRSRQVSNNVSWVSAIKDVRQSIVEQQRRVAQKNHVVMEGRDIGTVVFPGAEIKIFLNATVEERARRRYEELLAKGENATLEIIKQEVIERDRQDSEREHSPLLKAEGAIEIDSTGLTIEQVVEKITVLMKEKLLN
ncbi:Cytidylate kinase [sediment metagenome]|uniref:(d)CMP kinase n=1 Tax=sediment metagenome TaxID=749907 RepID=D9PMB9_9ZZZZ